MNINWKKVLGATEKIIHIIKEELTPTEREETHGKYHSDHSSNNSNNNKEREITDDVH